MTSNELVSKAFEVINKYKTVYGWGTFGWRWDDAALKRVAQQYPGFYTKAKKQQIAPVPGQQVFSFDCVGLIKGLLWGWSGNYSHVYGGASYQTNGCPDIDANVMISRCQGVSTSFSNIVPGEAVWIPGHIGIYVGEGKVIECTTAWKNRVQLSSLNNHKALVGLPGRVWQKHGKLPYVTYGSSSIKPPTSTESVEANSKVTIKAGALYGGLTQSKGKPVPDSQLGDKVHTVGQIKNQNGRPEALLREIMSWVPCGYLEVV
jgi:hypothetical protein